MVEEVNNKKNLISILAGIGALLIIIFLIIIKVNIPTFPLWQVILYSILVIIIALGIFFFSKYMAKNKGKELLDEKNGKVPPAITIEQAREMAVKMIMNPMYADYVGKNCLGERTYHMGKNVKNNIYCLKATGLYEKDIYYILINCNYPSVLRTVLINPKSEFEVIHAMKMLSQSPEEEPDMRKITTRNPILGTEQTIEETMKKEEKEDETKTKEGDL
jgi:hypothetical protein